MKRLVCLIIAFSYLYAEVAPKLLIKIPTRTRPDKVIALLSDYYKKISGKIPYHFLLSCDENDLSMNNPTILQKLSKFDNLSVVFGTSDSKVKAYNSDIDAFDFDILLVSADDMEPVVDNYDLVIAEKMLTYFPDFDGVLNFNDGFISSQCNTLPILGKKFYDRFKYIYYPGYKSLACDVELTIVSRILGKEAIFNDVIIKHNHPFYGQVQYDNLYLHNNSFHKIDVNLFYDRRKIFFDLKESDQNCNKLWSILLCTKNKSEDQLSIKTLKTKLENQIRDLSLQNEIEILTDTRELPISFKRNSLIAQSNGRYISFIDPEVDVTNNYINVLFDAIKNSPDLVEIVGINSLTDSLIRWGMSSEKIDSNSERTYCCKPNHFNLIKRIIVAAFPFWDNVNTDKLWSDMINKSGMLKIIESAQAPVIRVSN